jgi:DUF2911 family protein
MKILSFVVFGMAVVMTMSGATGNRKVTDNKLSPTADTKTMLGGKAVTIEYNAPSARNRKVEGGLVPYGSVWRLGADSATTLTTDTDLTIGTLKVPKGVYTLYILASEGGWKLIVNKQTGQWGTEYSEKQDLGRVDLKLTKLSQPAETLKITLKGSGSAGSLEITWGGTQASVALKAS